MTVESRFFAKVDKSGDCWLWTGVRVSKGYGALKIGGRHGKMVSAHRIAWELNNGKIPPGMHVCHRCDNPPCVRPDHLFLGSPSDNARDMIRKGRGRAGKVRMGKVTELDVRLMRATFALGGVKKKNLARLFGISPANACNIINRVTWKDFGEGPRGVQ